MSDLIDREALLRQIDIDSEGEPGYYGDTWKFIDTIKSMPPAELSTNLAEVGTDLISRQDAIGIVEFECGEWRGLARTIVKAIEQLPPANCSEFPNNSDTISKQAAINKILGQPPEPHYPSWYAEQIKELPSAQPEIILCKDCKHWIPYDWMFSEVWQSRNMADYPEDDIGCNLCDMAMKANDFCSRGERREVNHESN